ncbi:MAG: response regulator [Proteobacteria bacterium]|nr:MAG: response regulator [Pseudomonadota bacterium]
MTSPLYLVEDNPDIRAALIPLIEHCTNFRVVAFAETEDEAVEWLQNSKERVQTVVLDVYLRQGTGFGVLSKKTQFPPSRRVVVLTNSATPSVRQECLCLGASAVFDKSAELDAFVDYLQSKDK